MADQSVMNNSRYQLYGLIGKGGIGEVYRSQDTFFRRDVALKILHRDTLSPEFLRYFYYRFSQDAPQLIQFSNPNIIRLIEYTSLNNTPAWTMEYLSGNSYQQFCGQQIPYSQAAGMLIPVADALAYAHQFGIIHGNLKPSNILLNSNQIPVVTDFCLMRYLSENGHGFGNFEANAGIGSPDYLAPEQARGLQVDARTDIYSLGIIFYELVTGRRPFSAISPLDIMAKQVNEPLPSPKYFAQNISPAAEQAMYQATAKQPGSRISSMGEFALILRSLASDSGYGTFYPPASYYNNNFEEEDDEDDGKSIKELLSDAILYIKNSPKRMIIAGAIALLLFSTIAGLTISANYNKIAKINANNTQQAIELVQTQDAVKAEFEAQQKQTADAQAQLALEATNAAMKATNDAALLTAVVPTMNPAMIPTIDINATVAPTAAAISSGRYQSQTPNDGASFVMGEAFNMTWVIENNGGANWSTDYTLNFNSGTNFATGAVTSVNVPEEVWPGGATGITVPCTAPTSQGTYTMEWYLADAEGKSFLSPLTITINVVDGVLTPTNAIIVLSPTPTVWVDPNL